MAARDFKSLFLGSALIVGQSLAGVAVAQDSASAGSQSVQPADPERLETITVTGSRITRAGFDTVQPANVLSADLVDMKGANNVADIINELPAFGIATDNYGGQQGQTVGQNFVNAFGLGSNRTLTLINGRRVVSQMSAGSAVDPGLQVDLNILPSALIERVETIYTGGAPTYGSDAIAGTVNVIFKQDYEGMMVDAQYGEAEAGDAGNRRIRALLGGNFAEGRGNAVVTAEYSRVDAVDGTARRKSARDYSYCANPANTGPRDGIPNELICADASNFWGFPVTGAPQPGRGNWTGPQGGANGFFNAAGEPLLFSLDGQSLVTYNQAQLGRPYSAASSQGANGSANPYVRNNPETNSLVSPLDRKVVAALGHYDLNDRVRVYSEALFAQSSSVDRVNQGFFSGGLFPQNGGQLVVRMDNPYVSDQVRNVLSAQLRARDLNGDGVADDNPNNLDVDGNGVADASGFYLTRDSADIVGQSPNFREQDVLRLVTGLNGAFDALGSEWKWDVSYNFGRTTATTQSIAVDRTRLAYALDAVTDPATGQIACRVKVTPPAAPGAGGAFGAPVQTTDVNLCVPFNPLGSGQSANLGAVQEYLTYYSFSRSEMRQNVVDATLSGNPLSLPAGSLGVAAGLTYRKEQALFNVVGDPYAEDSNIAGKFDTKEAYLELLIPILADGSDWDLPVISRFEIEGAARHVDNSRSGSAVTWTAGGRLGLDLPGLGRDGVTFRGNVTRAIRSPSFAELLTPTTTSPTVGNDPCDPRFISGGPNPAARAANCQAQVAALQSAGLLPSAFDLGSFQSSIVNVATVGTISGNPNLANEESESWTVGVVFNPAFARGLRMSVDWTNIEINEAIASVNATQLLATCYDNADFPNNVACSRFDRDPTTFQVLNPQRGYLNAASRVFDGLIADLQYSFTLADLPYLSGAPGDVTISGTAFYTHRHEQVIAGTDRDEFADERGFEKWRWQANILYGLDRFSALWSIRYTSGGVYDAAATPELRSPGTFNKFIENDLSLRYRAAELLDLRFAVNNIFNHTDDATLFSTKVLNAGGGANNFRDILGRTYSVGVTMQF